MNRMDDSVDIIAPDPRLYNADIAPVLLSERTWGTWSIAALWVGMSVCITTYTLAAGMIEQGMTWRQAMFTIALGNLIVVIPMVLNAHPGTRYGIPFPVLLRCSFGTRGANVAALMRAFVACGWFGIQTWIGGSAIYILHSRIFGFEPAGPNDAIPHLGLSAGQFACFMLFWAVNMGVILMGIHSIRWLEGLAAPFLLLVGIALLAWSVNKAGGFGVVLSDETIARVRNRSSEKFDFWRAFWPNLTAMVGYWATLSLNIPDFSRYARRQRDQILGQFIGLPTSMTLYAFIGVAVTAATVVIFGEPVWDPVTLLGKFDNRLLVGFALFALTVATLTTNLAANVVSPANDFANLKPNRISFRTGGIITGVIAVLILPWRLYNDLSSYIFTWLIGYSALLGSIAGVMLAHYYVVLRCRLDVNGLYRMDGPYSFGGSGFNWRAFAAMGVGILLNVPGFIAQASGGRVDAPALFDTLYTYAWFVSLLLAGVTHLLLTALFPEPAQSSTVPVIEGGRA